MTEVDDVREDAIRRADAGATWQWKEAALQAIRRVAERKATLTSEDVWDEGLTCEGAGDGDALGPVMRKAAKLGYIKATGQFEIKTKRAQRHNNPKRVWASCLYAAESAA